MLFPHCDEVTVSAPFGTYRAHRAKWRSHDPDNPRLLHQHTVIGPMFNPDDSKQRQEALAAFSALIGQQVLKHPICA